MTSSLLSPQDVAQRWRVQKAHVYRLVRDGRLECVRLGRYVRFRVDALEEFERRGGTASNGGPHE